MVRVKPVANSGTLPLICESIVSISMGCICVRSKLQKGLDSYQEEDLNLLGDRWSEALMRRKAYLAEQFQKLINKQGQSSYLLNHKFYFILRKITIVKSCFFFKFQYIYLAFFINVKIGNYFLIVKRFKC